MAKKRKQSLIGTIITVVIVIAYVWVNYDELRDEQRRSGQFRDDKVVIPAPSEPQPGSAGHKEAAPDLRVVKLDATPYDVWRDCRLIDHRGNDGDSFHIRAPHGDEEIRLYFVDAPESAARTYGNGDTNHKRIAQQGAAMGGLDQYQTTQVGVAAKAFVKKLLAGQLFTIVTKEEPVYNSHRKYAFVIVDWQGESRYLHELLVAYGLGRIHTKPMTLPDNTAGSLQKKRLLELEKFARKNHYGAWGVGGN